MQRPLAAQFRPGRVNAAALIEKDAVIINSLHLHAVAGTPQIFGKELLCRQRKSRGHAKTIFSAQRDGGLPLAAGPASLTGEELTSQLHNLNDGKRGKLREETSLATYKGPLYPPQRSFAAKRWRRQQGSGAVHQALPMTSS